MTTWKIAAHTPTLEAMALLGVVAAAMPLASAARAAELEPINIGMVTTISGPAGYLGSDVRDGFMLVVEQGGGKLGGFLVKVDIQDDKSTPEEAKKAIDLLSRRDKTKIFTGSVFSHVMLASAPSAARQGAVFLSPVAGPSQLAGSGCNKDIFVVSEQNDETMEASGEIANKKGYQTAFILAPNYSAGKDALTGFKRTFKGKVLGERYPEFTQTDFSAEIAEIRRAKPDVVFQFLFGEAASNFINQYVDAGLKAPLLLTPYSLDEAGLDSLGKKAAGVTVATYWSLDLPGDANAKFVEAYKTKYNKPPSIYAATGYDTALVLAKAIENLKGDVNDQSALAKALDEAKVDSVRQGFHFGKNRFPVQDYYSTNVVVDPDGKAHMALGEKIFSDHVDAYAAECKN